MDVDCKFSAISKCKLFSIGNGIIIAIGMVEGEMAAEPMFQVDELQFSESEWPARGISN